MKMGLPQSNYMHSGVITVQSERQHLMPIFIGYYHLLYNLLNILISRFDNVVHLRSIRRRVMMLNFEGLTKLLHHFIVQIGPIVGDDFLGHSVRQIILCLMNRVNTCLVTLA